MKNYLIIYKNNGKFYNCYGYDAYIFNEIFNYKVLPGDKGGFPDNAINHVKEKLESLHISYQIVYRDKDIEIKSFEDNKYKEYLNIVINKLDRKKRIDLLIDKIKNLDSDGLDNIMKVLEKCLE